MDYPRSVSELLTYLAQHPKMLVRLPGSLTEYVFKGFESGRLYFTKIDGGEVSFALDDKFSFTEDGLVRRVGTKAAYYNYTGPKPWAKEKSPWQLRMEAWDLILAGIPQK